ncbi:MULTISPECIES: hypothetical protein [Streptomyces]|uniref:Uncharacterized protein n=1 Tax=Streptomyces katrae TaxID=68223 RepID=A0ABT7GTG0_9ACTN|nr:MULTISPECIES: hypothetical protein [Streptomyces]MDK9496901.1 hypothetical protein [Streptomyces katrae]RST01206.1 hypothetical protein EF910_28490 [Streptomyces sp. WAC07149]
MSAAGAERAPVVSMRALLAAGVAATAVSTPPSRAEAEPGAAPGPGAGPGRPGNDADAETAAPEPEAA